MENALYWSFKKFNDESRGVTMPVCHIASCMSRSVMATLKTETKKERERHRRDSFWCFERSDILEQRGQLWEQLCLRRADWGGQINRPRWVGPPQDDSFIPSQENRNTRTRADTRTHTQYTVYTGNFNFCNMCYSGRNYFMERRGLWINILCRCAQHSSV